MEIEPSRPATRVRYAVIAVCVAMSVLLYLDRVCVSIAEGYIRDDLGLSDQQMSWFLGVFFWTYAIAQVPTAALSERFGPRVMLGLYILGWSLFTLAMGYAGGFVSLLATRAGLGLAQAGAYPTSGLLVSRWIPYSGRGTASSLVAFGGRLGGALAPILTSWLILAFTPLSVPVAFTPDQIRDPVGFVNRLASANDPAAKPTSARDALVRLQRDFASDRLDEFRKLPLDEQRRELAELLNYSLGDADFVDPAWRKTLPLEREAFALLGRPRESLSRDAELPRLNRLVMEAVLPKLVHRLYGQGWRPTIVVFGLLGTLIALAYWVIVRDRPDLHPGCNLAERELIGQPLVTEAAPSIPLAAMLGSFSLWCMSAGQFLINVGWVLLVTNLPKFLDERFQVPLADRGTMQFIPLLVGIGGMLLGGQLTDRLVPVLGRRWGRSAILSGSKLLAVGAYLACPFLDSPWLVTIALAVVAFSTDLAVGATWAYAQDVGGRNTASILGWGNMWGNFGAAVAPVLFAYVLAWSGNDWNWVFYACAGACFLSGVASLGIDATKPIQSAQT